MTDIEFDESVAIPIYRPMLDNTDHYNIFYGSAGSGKSFFGIGQRTVFECIDQSDNRILIVRKVGETLRDSAFKDVCDTIEEWELDDLFKVNKTDMSIKAPNNNQIIFKGCDKVHKLKSISKITRVKIEEADELTEQEFNQLDLRLRGGHNYKQISLHFNPVDYDHWIRTRFFPEQKVDYSKSFNRYASEIEHPSTKERLTVWTSILKTTYLDNPYAGAEYEGTMQTLKEVDPVYYQVYALGEWGIIKPERPFADNFSRAKHVKRGLTYQEGYDLILSLDFNIDNSALAIQNTHDDLGNLKIKFLKEYHVKGWDLERLCSEILTDFPNATIKINGDASGRAGSALTAGNQSAYDLVKAYLSLSWMNFNVPNSNASHLNSRLLTNLILKEDGLVEIDEVGCPLFIKDLERMYVDKKGSLDEFKRKHPELGHVGDCGRYHFSAEHYERINQIGYSKLIEQ